MLFPVSLPFHHVHTWLTKGKQTPFCLWASSPFPLTLHYFRCSPSFHKSCTIPKLFCIPAFAMLSQTYKQKHLKPNHIPKAKANARSRSHMPGFSADFRSQTSVPPEANQTTKEVSREYGAHHHFQQGGT